MYRVTAVLIDMAMVMIVGTVTYAASESLLWMVSMQLLVMAYGVWSHRQGVEAMGRRVRARLEHTLAELEANIRKQQ